MRKNVHLGISILVLGFMALMIVAAIKDMRDSGSLDDLSADDIAKAVNG